jgi:predicted GIY-YIG superfamily endonuclease
MKKRDTYRYTLKDGNKTVYYGSTNDIDRRISEHKSDGKKFTHYKIEGPKVSNESSNNWEAEKLEKFRKSHNGENPKYNKSDKG